MPVDKNRRRHRRIPCINPVRISWEEQGQPRFAITKCIDISQNGLRMESPYPVRPGTALLLAAERIKLRGSATVKNVVRNGSKYLLGLELTQAILNETLAAIEGKPLVTLIIENFNRTD